MVSQRGLGVFIILFIITIVSISFIGEPKRLSGKPIVILGTPAPPLPELNGQQIEKGAALYIQYCADCHGINLEGQPNWKQPQADDSFPPPPHDSSGHTWHHPDALLLEIIKDGSTPGTKGTMPGFKNQLTETNIQAILEFIKSKWEKEEREYQWWINYTNPGN